MRDNFDITENLDDPDFCRGVVLSFRTYISFLNGTENRYTHLRDIAYGLDGGTKALIELQKMD